MCHVTHLKVSALFRLSGRSGDPDVRIRLEGRRGPSLRHVIGCARYSIEFCRSIEVLRRIPYRTGIGPFLRGHLDTFRQIC